MNSPRFGFKSVKLSITLLQPREGAKCMLFVSQWLIRNWNQCNAINPAHEAKVSLEGVIYLFLNLCQTVCQHNLLRVVTGIDWEKQISANYYDIFLKFIEMV